MKWAGHAHVQMFRLKASLRPHSLLVVSPTSHSHFHPPTFLLSLQFCCCPIVTFDPPPQNPMTPHQSSCPFTNHPLNSCTPSSVGA